MHAIKLNHPSATKKDKSFHQAANANESSELQKRLLSSNYVP